MFSLYALRDSPTKDSRRLTGVALVVALSSAALVWSWAPARAQGSGEYVGTIELSGTSFGPEVTYRATVEVRLPVSDRDATSVTAEFLAGEAPDATAKITQWDVSHTESSPDSDGKYSSWTCSLAEPTALQMTLSGSLYLDLRAKNYTLAMTLLSTRDVDFKCVHSRSGPFKKKEGVVLYAGTNIPGLPTYLPLTDRGHLATSTPSSLRPRWLRSTDPSCKPGICDWRPESPSTRG